MIVQRNGHLLCCREEDNAAKSYNCFFVNGICYIGLGGNNR